jgi:hypothetical protein
MDVCRRTLGFSFVLFLIFLMIAAPGRAQSGDGDPVVKVTALNKKALEQYARGDFEAARELLKQALDLCNSAGLDKHPIRARTHIHFGIVSIVGFKQREIGIKHFRKALELQPEIKLTKTLVTPELRDAFEEASVPDSGGAGTPATGDEGGAAPPAAQETGAGGGATADADAAGRRRPLPPPKAKSGKDDDDEEGDDDDEEGPAYRFYISIAAGSGFGLASGSGTLNPNHKLQTSGFAPAQLGHITPEIGFFVSPRFLLSARLRVQYVSGLTGEPTSGSECGADNYCTPSTIGFAGFLRGSYFFGSHSARFFVAGEVGGGQILHAQVFPSDSNCGMAGAKTQCVDTLKGGPFLFGPALGLLYDFGKFAGVVASVATDVGVPKFTVNFDLNLGLALHF